MVNSTSVGQLEQLLLTAILVLGDEAYGVTIHAKVRELVSPRMPSLGAIYVTLDRMEDKGLVSSRMSEPTARRGGRAKRCYRLTKSGERALRESTITAKRVSDLVIKTWGWELDYGTE